MVRYSVKSECVDDNERLVRAVYDELAATKPAGIRYATFREPDGVSFVHVASIETADGSNPLPTLAAFRAFTSGLKDRCTTPPTTSELATIGTYRTYEA